MLYTYVQHQRNLDIEEGTGIGPLREQTRSEGKVGGDEERDEEAEAERGIGQ